MFDFNGHISRQPRRLVVAGILHGRSKGEYYEHHPDTINVDDQDYFDSLKKFTTDVTRFEVGFTDSDVAVKISWDIEKEKAERLAEQAEDEKRLAEGCK